MKNLKNKKLKMFYMGKNRKYSSEQLAIATQRALHLPVTRIFDMRTLIVLNNLKENSIEGLRTLINKNLQQH